MSYPLSISDDDWPTEPDIDSQIRKCHSYSKITKEFENWSAEALKYLNS